MPRRTHQTHLHIMGLRSMFRDDAAHLAILRRKSSEQQTLAFLRYGHVHTASLVRVIVAEPLLRRLDRNIVVRLVEVLYDQLV